jgi:putative ABC transport system substrate-binding protein
MESRAVHRWAWLVALVFIAMPSAAQPQSAQLARIGVLSAASPDTDPCLGPLQLGLADLGHVEGRTYRLEPRFADGRTDRLPHLAADLIGLKVNLIVVLSATAVEETTKATVSIPVIMASSFYPVELGFVASLAHPGGNVTGVTHFTPELMAKRVQLLKEAVPTASRIVVLRLPEHIHDLVFRDMEEAARQLGVELQPIQVQHADDLAPAFETATRAGAQAVMSTQSPFFFQNSARIARLALEHRLPLLSGEPNAPEAGALLFYGPNVLEGCRRAARYIDRVLDGVPPADLPIEQPTKIRLAVNLKTAKALGLAIPPSLLARADEVIE